jgi:N-acetylmuramoyl-L-alanine amidase
VSYTLSIDGVEMSGKTDDQGMVACNIRADAVQGKLVLRDQEQDEVYELLLGHLDPISVTSGVQARLNHLGFWCGAVDGIVGPRTRHAVKRFQAAHALEVTGEIDNSTRDALADAHGC